MAIDGGAYTRDKNTRVRTLAENIGGAYTQGGAYMRDTTVLTLNTPRETKLSCEMFALYL